MKWLSGHIALVPLVYKPGSLAEETGRFSSARLLVTTPVDVGEPKPDRPSRAENRNAPEPTGHSERSSHNR